MHTIMVIGGGFLLLALFAILGKATSLGLGRAMLWFLPAWFVCAAYNMWIGVSRAGYSFADELPIFLPVFAVPAIAALILRQWLAR